MGQVQVPILGAKGLAAVSQMGVCVSEGGAPAIRQWHGVKPLIKVACEGELGAPALAWARGNIARSPDSCPELHPGRTSQVFLIPSYP